MFTPFQPYIDCPWCLQIVVTDIDECIEALADNMAPNLPEGCCLRTVHPSSEAQQPSAADPSSVDGWDLPQSIIQVAAQDFPIDQAASQRHSEQPLEGQNAAPQPAECDVPADERHSEASGCILSLENLHIGNGSSDHQHADHSGGNSLEAKIDLQQSEGLEVVVRSLDWREDPQHLSPPFDLVLVADVVSFPGLNLSLRSFLVVFCKHMQSDHLPHTCVSHGPCHPRAHSLPTLCLTSVTSIP